jgi:DNA-binding XRE family transcriptional regulator
MQNKVHTGEKLRLLRVKRNISQAKLAKAIFVKNTTISNWENGSRQIHLNNLKLICVYFDVPLSYFSDQATTEMTQKKLPMRTIVAASGTVALAVSLGVVLLGGPNGILNDACYGEENCYVINDPSIVSELQTRNLNGGLMTNVEIDLIYEHLEQYLLDEETDINQGLVAMLNLLGYPEPEMYYQQRMLYHDDGGGLPNYIFNLRELNEENLQYFIYQNDKYIVYKIGPGRFRYEVYANSLYTLTIDLSMNAFYWNDKKFIPPLDILDRFKTNKVRGQTSTIIDTEEMTFIEDLSIFISTESLFNGEHTTGAIGFYNKITNRFYSVNFIGSYGIYGVEYGLTLQHRIGIQSGGEFRFNFINYFDDVYENFPAFVNQPGNVLPNDIGGGFTNDFELFNDEIAPLFISMGDRPLHIYLSFAS